MRVIMGVFVPARFTVERQEHQTPAVEGCEHCRNQQHPEGITTACAGPCAFDDGVLRKEARKSVIGQRNTDTRDCQRTDHHCPEGIWDFLTQTAVVAHVLFMMHRMDHRPRTKEQHRLEKRVCEQVEHRNRINTHTRSHKHVSQLRTG